MTSDFLLECVVASDGWKECGAAPPLSRAGRMNAPRETNDHVGGRTGGLTAMIGASSEQHGLRDRESAKSKSAENVLVSGLRRRDQREANIFSVAKSVAKFSTVAKSVAKSVPRLMKNPDAGGGAGVVPDGAALSCSVAPPSGLSGGPQSSLADKLMQHFSQGSPFTTYSSMISATSKTIFSHDVAGRNANSSNGLPSLVLNNLKAPYSSRADYFCDLLPRILDFAGMEPSFPKSDIPRDFFHERLVKVSNFAAGGGLNVSNSSSSIFAPEDMIVGTESAGAVVNTSTTGHDASSGAGCTVTPAPTDELSSVGAGVTKTRTKTGVDTSTIVARILSPSPGAVGATTSTTSGVKNVSTRAQSARSRREQRKREKLQINRSPQRLRKSMTHSALDVGKTASSTVGAGAGAVLLRRRLSFDGTSSTGLDTTDPADHQFGAGAQLGAGASSPSPTKRFCFDDLLVECDGMQSLIRHVVEKSWVLRRQKQKEIVKAFGLFGWGRAD